MDDNTLDKLRGLGHEIGRAAVSPDGKMLIAVDGRMLTYPEIDKLLVDHLKEKEP
jgi:hypothetical protein